MCSGKGGHDALDAGNGKSALFHELVLPYLGGLDLTVLDRIDRRFARLGRNEFNRDACIDVVKLDVLFFQPLLDLAEGEGDVRIARVLISFKLLGDARSDEYNDYVIAIEMPQISAVRLER